MKERTDHLNWSAVLVTVIMAMGGGLKAQESADQQLWGRLLEGGGLGLAHDADVMRKQGETAREQRVALANYLSNRYLSNPGSIVSIRTGVWKRLMRALREDMSESQRSEWAKAFMTTYRGPSMGEGRVLTAAETIGMISEPMARRFLSDYILTHDDWRSWSPYNLTRLCWVLRKFEGEDSGSRQEAYDEALVARKALFEYLNPLLTSDKQARSIEPRTWGLMAQTFADEMSRDQRQKWIDIIRSEVISPKAIEELRVYDVAMLVNGVARLGDKRAWEVLATYLCGTPRPKSFTPGFRLGLLEGHGSGRDGKGVLADRVWTAFSGSPPGLASLGTSSLEDLTGLLRWHVDMTVSLAQMERRCSEIPMAEAEVRWEEDPVSDYEWALLCWRTIVAKPEDRERVWETGVAGLPPDSVLAAERILSNVKTLLTVLEGTESNDLTPERVLTDLLGVSRDSDLVEALPRMRDSYRLQQHLAASPEFRSGLQTVRDLDANSRNSDAIAACSKLVGDARQGGKEQLAALLERELLVLLSKQGDGELGTAERLLQAVAKEEKPLSDELWNITCRLLLRRVEAAGPAEKMELWVKGVAGLRQDRIHISQETFADLDRFLKSLPADESRLANRVPADLLTLAPDIPSMRRLQQRRVDILIRESKWDQAISAALLEVMLGNVTAEGPLASIRRLEEIMKSSGTSSSNWQVLLARWALGGSQAAGDSRPAEPPDWQPPTDESLKTVATEALLQSDDILARRRGYLFLFTGDFEKALRQMHEGLASAGSDAGRVRDDLDDMAVVVAMAEGDIHGATRLVRWSATQWAKPGSSWLERPQDKYIRILADYEKDLRSKTDAGLAASQPGMDQRQLVGQKLERCRQQRLVRWGAQALEQGSSEWAAGLWAAAIDSASDRNSAVSVIRAILFRIRCSDQGQNALKVLEAALSRLQAKPSREILLRGIADLHYAESRLAQCLESLDRADALAQDMGDVKDVFSGLIRARCLVSLQKFTDALGVLDRMTQWPGTDEQHAQIIFLIGWIHLKEDRPADALGQFEKIIEAYPNTTVADRAKQIVADLKHI